MKTLSELLALGQQLEEEQRQRQEDAKTAAEHEKQARCEHLKAAALEAARRDLGPVFDELNPSEWNIDKWHISALLDFGLRYRMVDGRTELWLENESELHFPAPIEKVALYVLKAQQREMAEKERQRRDLERETDEAVKDILQGGSYEFEYNLTPEDIYSRIEYKLADHPDLKARLLKAMETWRAHQAEETAKAAALQLKQVEVQSKVWIDFTIWRLTYAARADGEEDGLYTETAYSLAPYPNGDGWWPVVRHNVVTITRFPALLKVEKLNVTSPNSHEAKAVCRKSEYERVTVLEPPIDAVALELSPFCTRK
jgi:hypothetical protein